MRVVLVLADTADTCEPADRVRARHFFLVASLLLHVHVYGRTLVMFVAPIDCATDEHVRTRFGAPGPQSHGRREKPCSWVGSSRLDG